MKKKILPMLILACVLFFGIVTICHAKGTPQEAKAMVEKAIAFYKSQGKEKAFVEIGDPNGQFMKDDIYVTVYDMNGVCLARPVEKAMIGKNMMGLQDAAGKLFIKERLEMVKTKGRGWQDYKFPHPVTKKWELKTAYFDTYDNLVFTSGAYK
jgi:hypothetical protein